MRNSPKQLEKLPALLAISHREAEWFETSPDGQERYGMALVAGTSPQALVQAACSARQLAGGKCKRFAIALSGTLVSQRLVTLPNLAKRELYNVMSRKAARDLPDPAGRVLFSSTEHAAVGTDGSSSWSLSAIDHARIKHLVLGLRDLGLHAKRITAEEQAVLDQARRLVDSAEEQNQGTICVAVELDCIRVSLISGDDLYLREVLEGNFKKMPHLVASLLQSINTTAGYWRRMKRGAGIASVVVLGLGSERSTLLSAAIQKALPEAKIRIHPAAQVHTEEGTLESPDAGRIAMLKACQINGSFSPRLDFQLPRRRSSVLVTCMLVVVGAMGSFVMVDGKVDQRVASLDHEIQSTSAARAELALLEGKRSQVAHEIQEIHSALDRAQKLIETGLDTDSLLRQLSASFEGRAGILSLNLERDRAGRSLRIEALAQGDAVSTIQAIGDIQRLLEADPLFDEVRVDLPSRVEASDGQTAIRFHLTSRFRQSS